MDLEVEEVSELLNISKEILIQWISEGKIPAYRIKEQYRFNRQEIENWLLRQKQSAMKQTTPSRTKGQDHFNLYRAIHKGDVITDITSDVKEIVLAQIATRIAPQLKLDPDILTEHLLERERLMPTALGHGFGIPHTKDFLLRSQHDTVVVVFLQKPINYGSLDKESVHTLFFLLACNDRQHLALLSKIAHLVQSSAMRDILNTHPPKRKLLSSIKDWEATLL